jgi:hypothetical protein
MPSLVTDNFRVFAAEQFIESLAEPFNNSNNAEADSSAAAQAYRSKIYLFIGRSQSWPLEKYSQSPWSPGTTDQAPPDVQDSFNDSNEIYDDMIAVKRINSTDVSKVIKRITYVPNVKYDMYRNDYTSSNPSLNAHSNLYDSQSYVVNSNFQVFKCIFNGFSEDFPQAKASTVEPTGIATSIQTLSDGYRWKYLYTINISDYIKFVSSDFMPVKVDSTISAAAVDGAVEQYIVDVKGSGNAVNTVKYCPVLGDGTTNAIAKVTINSSGEISSIISEIIGAGYTRAKIMLNEAYTTSAFASARTGESPTSISGTATAIISPPGGHGANPPLELGGYRVMVNKSLEFLDGDGDIPVNSQFRRFGLISDPKVASGSTDLISDTATACFAIKFPSTTNVNFTLGEIITEAATGAKGRVIHWDSVTKVLRYYQNEYIDKLQTTPLSAQYKLIPFSGNRVISQGSGSNLISATPDVTADSPVFGVAFTDGYAVPEIKKNSGNIIYVENRKPVNRSTDQTEDIKLVIEF